MRYPIIGTIIIALAAVGLWLLFAGRHRRPPEPARPTPFARVDGPAEAQAKSSARNNKGRATTRRRRNARHKR